MTSETTPKTNKLSSAPDMVIDMKERSKKFETIYYEPQTLWIKLKHEDGSDLWIDFKKIYVMKGDNPTQVWAVNDSQPFRVSESAEQILERVTETMKELL